MFLKEKGCRGRAGSETVGPASFPAPETCGPDTGAHSRAGTGSVLATAFGGRQLGNQAERNGQTFQLVVRTQEDLG